MGEAAAVARRLEDVRDGAWRRDACALADRVTQAALAGGPAAIGWSEVLDLLVQHRVERLIFTAGAPSESLVLAPHVARTLGWPPAALLVERAVEQAIISGAAVTALPEHDASALSAAGGVAATLRW